MFADAAFATRTGSYVLTGRAVGLVSTLLGSCQPDLRRGSYSPYRQAVGLPASRVLAAEAGSWLASAGRRSLRLPPAEQLHAYCAERRQLRHHRQDISFARTYVPAALPAATRSPAATSRSATAERHRQRARHGAQ